MMEGQKIQAKLHNGDVLEFPEGTPDEVVDKAVQEHLTSLSSTNKVDVDPKTIAPPLVTAEQVLPEGLQKNPKNAPTAIPQNPITSLVTKATLNAASEVPWKDRFKSMVNATISGAAGLGAGLALENPLAGSAMMAATDHALRAFEGDPENMPGYGPITKEAVPNIMARSFLDVTSNTVANELMNLVVAVPFKLGGAAWSGLKEAFNPGSIIDAGKFKPTFSQLAKNEKGLLPSITKPLSKIAENIFARGAKEGALDTSSALGYTEAQKLAQGLLNQGGTGAVLPSLNLEELALKLKNQSNSDYTASLLAASSKAEDVKRLAGLETKIVSTPGTPVQTGIGPNGQPIMHTPIVNKTIEGPIELDGLAHKLVALKDDTKKALGDPDPNNPLYAFVDSTLRDLGYSVDKAGTVTLTNGTVSFETAWATRKKIGMDAFENTDKLTNEQRRGYKAIYQEISDNISDGIDKWKNPLVKDAKQLWGDMNEITREIHANYFPEGETGGSLESLLKTGNAPDPMIDTVFYDYKKTERFLTTGEMTLASGEVITASNKRQVAKSYMFSSIFDNAWKPLDAAEKTVGKTNIGKLEESWINYRDSKAGKLIYNKADREVINEFVNNIKRVDETLPAKSTYFALRAGSTIATFSAGVTSSLLAGTGVMSAGAIGGVGVLGGAISLHAVGKVLTNPEAARVLLAMQRGTALGMSTRMASRIIANALKGEAMSLDLGNGKKLSGSIDSQGNWKVDK